MEKCPAPEETNQNVTIPLFLIALPRTKKLLEILNSPLCHTVIKVEDYQAEICLTQCYNNRKFSHIWVHCRQHPHCLSCRCSHRHKGYPEKENNYTLKDVMEEQTRCQHQQQIDQ
jgi:hypothetical protein